MNDDNVVVPEITPNELSARFELGHAPVLVDVRELFEREIVDLPDHGQLSIPTGQFIGRIGELDPAEEVVVYCRSGGRSEQVARYLMQNGFEHVLNLRGGILGWRQEVDPSLPTY
ncbi:MAG: sulfurtransferase [Gemmatimonadetes bacterium]|nr:sulfurtransferase [Gemmatimonadota bacterium]|tara:strand:+ start:517 stop:861 length:345 start_codon:yes stop_codon:yes gene_type:complete